MGLSSDDASSSDSSASDSSSSDSSSDASSTDSSSNGSSAGAALDPTRWSSIISGAISSNATLRTGNAVTYLIDGPATFKEMVRAIGTATSDQHYIYLLGWQLVDDFDMDPPAATQFKDLMTSAAASGVQIRVMLWKQYKGINQPQVDFINTLSTGAAILDNETTSQTFGAHHQKVLVVKGSEGLVGFCGGLDINSDRVAAAPGGSAGSSGTSSGLSGPSSDDSSSSSSDDGGLGVAASGPSGGQGSAPLHDTHCEITGPAAWDVLLTFIRRWDHHPDSPSIDAAKGGLLGRGEPVPASASTPSSTGASCSVAIARTFTPVTPGSSVPKERDIRSLVLASIANAQRFIYMEDQYLISLDAAGALNARIPALSHVTIVIAGSEISDLPCRWTYRNDFINAVTSGLSATDAAKLRVFRLVTPPASTPPVYGTHTYVHSKCWVFDDELAVIGSANCNRRGYESDSEANAFIFDDAAPSGGALTFAQQFRSDLWAEHLSVPSSSVTDGVASAGLWLSPPSGARILRYDPAADSDGVVLMCGTAFTRDKVDPPSP
jgi:phosphatidylserine/phosphatidylglycerophosphate/cardiolipin synthase-like enzyme